MSLEERAYSVLVASTSQNINSALSALLPESAFSRVHTVSSVSAARRIFAERPFDLVIVNSPLPDDTGVRFAIDVCAGAGTVALLLVKSEIYMGIYDKVVPHGVFTLPRPTSKQALSLALSWLASARERLRKMEKKTLSIEEKMEEIRLVNRAKWILIDEQGMDEPAAHHYIERQAMNLCITKRQAAEDIIHGRENR
ncbi:MAG: response regulator [Acetatifactor sp.]|nr:response regulator [Acetatifactor sp.]MDE7354937.1 response regulator [Acetatifactor sp.]